MARGFRTKIDLPLKIAFNLTPKTTKTCTITLNLNEFTALGCNLIGIRLAVKDTRQWSVATLNAIDATDNMRPNWPELDFAYELCFLGRPRRGKIRNCPSPSSLKNQASKKNDIPDHIIRAKLQNPHAKVAKTHFTWQYSHFKLQL